MILVQNLSFARYHIFWQIEQIDTLFLFCLVLFFRLMLYLNVISHKSGIIRTVFHQKRA